jgi:hypothetical protein
LKAFGLVNLIIEPSKITENAHLQLFTYIDELRNAYENNEIYQSEKSIKDLHNGEYGGI